MPEPSAGSGMQVDKKPTYQRELYSYELNIDV